MLNTSATNATRHNLCSEIEKRFASRNITARLLITRTAAELPQLAANAASQAVEAVIAAGGDGTVSTIAGSLAHGSIPLGILPLGNLNHFAKDLRIPLDLESAIDTITAGKTTPVDIASVNGIHFVNNSSLGLYPMIVRYREMQQRRGLRKWQAFVRAVLIAFRRYPFFQVQVTMNGQTLVRATPFAFVGNNMYQVEGLRIGSRSSLTGGLLCLYIVHGLGRLGLLRTCVDALLGRLHRRANFDFLRAAELRIDLEQPQITVARDGELTTLMPPLAYRIHPRALQVIAP